MPDPSQPTVKQQRDARRAVKVVAMQKQLAAQKRNRRIGLTAAITGGALVIGLIVTFVVVSATPKPDPSAIDIPGLTTFGTLTPTHVDGAVDYQADYGMNPPAGGNHNAVWLNCGVYDQPQQNENAVHSLEHGAVWITYDPSALTPAEIDTLRGEVPGTYSILSPYPALPAPVVISAWSAQVQLDGVDDPRLQLFIQKFWKSATAPEPGAACTGALDGPGKVS
ncbi:MAG: DUF3105 domain-containing protein [Salinibacterium sp.]|nr:DUF3105 domain-containing protein [Salinibacterium sp.]